MATATRKSSKATGRPTLRRKPTARARERRVAVAVAPRQNETGPTSDAPLLAKPVAVAASESETYQRLDDEQGRPAGRNAARSDGVRLLRREGALRRHLPPLRLQRVQRLRVRWWTGGQDAAAQVQPLRQAGLRQHRDGCAAHQYQDRYCRYHVPESFRWSPVHHQQLVWSVPTPCSLGIRYPCCVRLLQL